MAGLKKTRVDYGDNGPVTKTDDKETGANRQDSSIVQPTRAQRPVGSVTNKFTSDESASQLATRPTSEKK